jgi:glycosyltransferase involved in cell wall biosynthesis
VHACYRESRSASAALGVSLVLHRTLGTYSRVNRFIAVSRFVRDKYVEAGLDPSRVLVKSNFAWPAEPRMGPGSHLLFLGRLTPEKGLATIVRTLPPTLGLVVAGDGSERASLESKAGQNVTFLGQVEGSEVPGLLRAARALVVPSQWYEGQPRAIVEAFASGVPVIASRIGGLPELVDEGVNGRLVEPGNDLAWRHALEGITDDAQSMVLGHGALATWQRRFTPEIAIRALEDAYGDAVSGVPRSA